MIKIRFKNRYRTVHLTNELGTLMYSGVHVHVSEQYRYRDPDTGFILFLNDMNVGDFDALSDVAVITDLDIGRLGGLDFDTLVIHHWHWGIDNRILYDLLQDKRLVYVMHGMPIPVAGECETEWEILPERYKWLCERAERIICVSRSVAERLRALYPGCANKLSGIYNGLTLPQEPDLRARDPGQRCLGHIGRMDSRKALLNTLKAVRPLDGVELHVACNTMQHNYLRLVNQYLTTTGVNERVHLHGYCVGDRKHAFFQHVDAVVIPSLWEPFGYVVLEAIAYGKPPIVANDGGMREIVGSDYRYQFDPYSMPAQTAALKSFLTDPVEQVTEEFSKLTDRLPMFSGETMVARYRTLLNSL